jgi:hypothetical protein
MHAITNFLKVVVRLGILPPLFMVEEILRLPANLLAHLNDALYEVTTLPCEDWYEECACEDS